MLKIYFAQKMTGRTGRELCEDAEFIEVLSQCFNIISLNPVVEEGVKDTDELVGAPLYKLAQYWQRDKEMIRSAHVVIDCSGPEKSEGVAAEIGYARFFLYKPVIRVWPGLGPSVARIEGDFIAANLPEAMDYAVRHWGTRKQRIIWRLQLLRCLPKAIFYKTREWVNVL